VSMSCVRGIVAEESAESGNEWLADEAMSAEPARAELSCIDPSTMTPAGEAEPTTVGGIVVVPRLADEGTDTVDAGLAPVAAEPEFTLAAGEERPEVTGDEVRGAAPAD